MDTYFFPQIIAKMHETFDSHEFIEAFRENLKAEYNAALESYDGDERMLHQVIANHLKRNASEYRIEQLPGEVESVNVHGNMTPNKRWRRNNI